jgi:hypothetical protein
VLTLVANL